DMALPLAIVEALLVRTLVALDCAAALSCVSALRHHSRLAQPNLPVRYSGSENEIDRKLFCGGVWTRLIFLYPPLLGHRLKRRRKFPLKRPQIEGELTNRDLPVIPPVPNERCNHFIERPYPPFSDNRTRCGPSHLVDLESNKCVMGLPADKTGVVGDLLKNEYHIKLRDWDLRIQLRHPRSQRLLVFSRERAGWMIDFPQRHRFSLLLVEHDLHRACLQSNGRLYFFVQRRSVF